MGDTKYLARIYKSESKHEGGFKVSNKQLTVEGENAKEVKETFNELWKKEGE